MAREFCSFCGTLTNEGEIKCATREAANKCSWMGGVHSGAIVLPDDNEEPFSYQNAADVLRKLDPK